MAKQFVAKCSYTITVITARAPGPYELLSPGTWPEKTK